MLKLVWVTKKKDNVHLLSQEFYQKHPWTWLVILILWPLMIQFPLWYIDEISFIPNYEIRYISIVKVII